MNLGIKVEQIHVNIFGDFDEGCICGEGDFYPVKLLASVDYTTEEKFIQQQWIEVEPSEDFVGYACVNCNRIFSETGYSTVRPKTIVWLP